MSTPFLAEIRIVSFNFAPKGWALCNGQLLPIMQNTALFSLLGTTYGGNGVTTFALPDLRGRAALCANTHPLGEQGGAESVTLNPNQIPPHTHAPACSSQSGDQQSPAGGLPAREARGVTAPYSGAAPNTTLNPQAIGASGGSQPHNNMQPYTVLNFVIALSGIFPSRS